MAERRGEVDAGRRVARRVDPAAVEVGVDQVVARGGLIGPEVVGVAEAREDDLVAVGEMWEELALRVLGRRREVELAADQERLDLRVADARVLVLVGARRP